MGSFQSLDENKIIVAVLHDVWNLHGNGFNSSSLNKTLKKVERRLEREGIGFLTKTLPRLGKALDKALIGERMNSAKLGFKPQPGSELPRFLGEFFNRILAKDGTILPHPCVNSVRVVRQVLYLFYKYELPYSVEQELSVIEKFKRTDRDLQTVNDMAQAVYCDTVDKKEGRTLFDLKRYKATVLHRARILLARLFARFDPKDIFPRNGPGAVAGRQRPWEKFAFRNVSANITATYPYDAYFCASAGHVCDTYKDFGSYTEVDSPARVILVPKDSRGPRLISAEPVDYQWVQQGLSSVIVRLVEGHPLTKWNVFFTDQTPNQRGALLGSTCGRYATLDLNEASDRVSVGLVRLLFPSNVFECLMACRSSATELPDGEVLRLQKFAPMGSSLCFPVMALTIWAILTAAAPDRDTRESVLVYGDDVIVPTAYAADAIEQLEGAGLKVNLSKSCTSGLFRESCGTDAFQGVNVTPVRLRTVWSESRSPNVFESFIAYANEFHKRQYWETYNKIAGALHAVYGAIPEWTRNLSCPSLLSVPQEWEKPRVRVNKGLQRLEQRVLVGISPHQSHTLPGWQMLLRYFSEKSTSRSRSRIGFTQPDHLSGARPAWENPIHGDEFIGPICANSGTDTSVKTCTPESVGDGESGARRCDREICLICGRGPRHLLDAGAVLSVSSYTQRTTSKLVRRWR